MGDDDIPRLEKAGTKAGLSPEGAKTLAIALAKEIGRERLAMEAQITALRAEMEKMELRMTIKGILALGAAVGILAAIIKL